MGRLHATRVRRADIQLTPSIRFIMHNRQRTLVLSVAVSALAATACVASTKQVSDVHSTVTVSACPEPQNDTRRDPANLVLVIRTDPAIPPGDSARADVRVEGETYRSDSKVSVVGGSQFVLDRGVYDLRVSLTGYEPVMARATLTGACTSEMIATLRKR